MPEIYDLIVERFKAGNRPVDIMKEFKNLNATRDLVYKTINRFKRYGSGQPRPRGGKRRTVRTPEMIKSIRNKIAYNPHRSFRKMAREAGIDPKTVRKIVREDLGMKSYCIQKRQLLTDVQKQKRLDCSRKLLRRLKNGDLNKFVFTDEKLFTVEAVRNPRNDRVVAKNIKAIPGNKKFHLKRKHPAGIMVWAGISMSGKTPLVFIPPGVKMTADWYIQHVLQNPMKDWAKKKFKNNDWIFQQDGAPAHTANKTQDWLKKEFPDFLPRELWPPSSPDLNPMDYSVWSYLESKVCRINHANVDALKSAIQKEWDKMSMDFVSDCIKAFRGRLERVIDARGGHFE